MSRPRANCDHARHYARGLCRCRYDQLRGKDAPPPPPRTNVRAPVLAARAERLHAELVRAEGYSTAPATWGEVARQLGVKPTTLERARTRAKQYAARGAS